MSRQQTNVVLQHVRKVLAVQENERLSDGELLECYARTADEMAFATLVRRHGTMVLHVCQRILHNWHDAEDACQAVFLVLARRAGARCWRQSVGPWLYRVAYRLALRVQSDVKKHARLKACGPENSAIDPLAAASGRELCTALDGELSLLPTRLQAPLVLCCLEVSRAMRPHNALVVRWICSNDGCKRVVRSYASACCGAASHFQPSLPP